MSPDNYEVLMKLTCAYNNVGEDKNSSASEEYFKKSIQYAKILVKKYPANREAYYYLAHNKVKQVITDCNCERLNRNENNTAKTIQSTLTIGQTFNPS